MQILREERCQLSDGLLECWTKRTRLKTKLSAAPTTIAKGFESERHDKSSTNHTVAARFYILYLPAAAAGQQIRVVSQDVLIYERQCSVSATCGHQHLLNEDLRT